MPSSAENVCLCDVSSNEIQWHFLFTATFLRGQALLLVSSIWDPLFEILPSSLRQFSFDKLVERKNELPL